MNENRKRKAGRPPAEDPLCIDVKVRLTQTDADALDEYCSRHDTRRAVAIRSAILRMLKEDAEK